MITWSETWPARSAARSAAAVPAYNAKRIRAAGAGRAAALAEASEGEVVRCIAFTFI
jgi:hypothetical protein